MPAEDARQLTLNSIADWSKWITGLSIFSAGGCITVMLTKGVGEKNILNIKLAIIFFLIALFLSWIIQLIIAELKQHIIPDTGAAAAIKDPITVLSFKTLKPLLRLMVFLELIIFFLAVYFLAKWIWNIPSPSAPPQQTEETVRLPADTI
jgi:hypothetical protein